MKRFAAAALLLTVSVALALLAAETVVRYLRPGFVAGPASEGNPFWVRDAELGWFHRPGRAGTFSREEFTHPVSINSLGFRDREWTTAREPGGARARIAVLGDSFTWGHGVGDDEIFTALVEDLLPGVEVWNLAVSAYSTDQELLLLRRTIGTISPDLVLVMVSRNDFPGNVSKAWSAYPKPRFIEEAGALRLTNVPVPEPRRRGRAIVWLRRHSALVNGLLWTLGADGQEPGRPLAGREEEIRITLLLLEEMRQASEASGAALAVGLVPSTAHVYYGDVPEVERRRFDAVRSWCSRQGVPALDLVAAFREAFSASGRHFHYPKDKHWNAAGHRLAAESMAPLLDRILADLAS